MTPERHYRGKYEIEAEATAPGYFMPRPPPVWPYREGAPLPNGYHVETRPKRSMIIGGAALLGNIYLLSVIGALAVLSDNDPQPGQFGPLFIPILGPFITLGTAHSANLARDNTKGMGTLMILDGLFQATGAALIVGGAMSTRNVAIRNDLASAGPGPEVLVGPGSASVRYRF